MSETTENPIRDAIAEAIRDHEVILFMKGTPERPRCGFSARTVAVLDASARSSPRSTSCPTRASAQELSAISNWPTIPQLFVKGELVGGCDIVTEMYETGELAEVLGVDSRPRPRAASKAAAPGAPPQIQNDLVDRPVRAEQDLRQALEQPGSYRRASNPSGAGEALRRPRRRTWRPLVAARCASAPGACAPTARSARSNRPIPARVRRCAPRRRPRRPGRRPRPPGTVATSRRRLEAGGGSRGEAQHLPWIVAANDPVSQLRRSGLGTDRVDEREEQALLRAEVGRASGRRRRPPRRSAGPPWPRTPARRTGGGRPRGSPTA